MTSRVEVTRYQGDLSNPDRATAQTIAVMCDQIQQSAQDPAVQRAAQDAVRRFRGGPLYVKAGINATENLGAIAESCWWAAKAALKFEHHEDRIYIWFKEQNQLQLLISPSILVRFASKGDCAIYTGLICAFLQALNQPYEIVTAAVDPRQPGVFGHVYPRAVMPDGTRIALDASHGSYPGWEVPAYHVIRKQVWDQDGNPISDYGPKFMGLHVYYARGFPPGLSGLRGLRRGLGQGDTVTALDPSVIDTSNIPITNPAGGYPVPSTSGGGFNWGSTIGNLLSAWTKIGGQVIAPQTTVIRGPGGQTYIQTPAGSPTGAASLAATASGIPIWVWAIGGGLMIWAFAKSKG